MINIVGLSRGITVFILIMVYVDGELSADKFNENYDRIYHLERYENFGITGITIKDLTMEGIPEIESGSRRMISLNPSKSFHLVNRD